MIKANTEELIRMYFISKTKQLLASSCQALCDHAGLKGSHREDVIRIYLSEIIPRRYGIGRGMIYSPFTRSHETDIMIHDSTNFPRLQMHGYEFYFAEAVHAAIEVKSSYTIKGMKDIVKKTSDLKEMIIPYTEKLSTQLLSLEGRLDALESGDQEYLGSIKRGKEIVSTAIILHGGKQFTLSKIEKYEDLEKEFPDILLFLEEGRVFVKYLFEEGNYIRMFQANEDALLLFTKYFLEILDDQITAVEGTLYFDNYIRNILKSVSYVDFPFPVTRPLAKITKPLFRQINIKG